MRLAHLSKITLTGLLISLLGFSCEPSGQPQETANPPPPRQLFSAYSTLTNTYEGFHSPKAINCAAAIENTYFEDYAKGISPFHGTEWAKEVQAQQMPGDSISVYEHYVRSLPDSLTATAHHCTSYAIEALKAGFEGTFPKIDSLHKKHYRDHEYAGWSIAYVLCQYYGWKAYLYISPHSAEYHQCQKVFQQKKAYPVWKQPDVPLEAMYVMGEQDSLFQSLLTENEFGWGFSYQGWHTWFTRFDMLKECYWGGAPAAAYDPYQQRPLFIQTPFRTYHDYDSHVVCFPPKKS